HRHTTENGISGLCSVMTTRFRSVLAVARFALITVAMTASGPARQAHHRHRHGPSPARSCPPKEDSPGHAPPQGWPQRGEGEREEKFPRTRPGNGTARPVNAPPRAAVERGT